MRVETPEIHQLPYTSSESAQMPDVEEIMKCPWGSFDQLLVFRRHIREDGKMITKGFGASIAFMPGVTSEMREDIMDQTLGIENPYVQRWQGEKQGEIFCMSKDLDEAPDIYGLIRKFIQVAGDVIDQKHPFRNHQRVERFLSVQGQRLNFAATVAKDAQRILDTPEFTGWSSMNPKYKGKGKVYLIEIYEEDGIVYGSCPDGSIRPLSELPIDEAHKRSIKEGIISMVKRPMLFPEGYRIGGDGEDTETVSKCGVEDDEHKGSCSDFFEFMESDIEIVNISVTYSTTVAERFIQVIDTFGRVHTFCSSCKKIKEECNCKEK